MLAHRVGNLLGERAFVAVPFAGGLSELVHIKARTIVANDLHYLMINLARLVAHPKFGPKLIRRLRRHLFHPAELEEAQIKARNFDGANWKTGEGIDWWTNGEPNLDAAEAYFIAVWQGRNGEAGTDGELKAGLSVRWEAGGGDSAKRYRGAVDSLREWQRILQNVTFTCLDFKPFLDKQHDNVEHGIYSDAPWPQDGDGYKHKFTPTQQAYLELGLRRFEKTRVVVRFGDHPLIRDLYRPEYGWTWHELNGRTSANKTKKEVLITRN